MVFEEILGYLLKRFHRFMGQIIRKTGNFAAIILLILVSFSCITTQSLIIEIPQPSGKELPANIQSLTLVNRTINNKYQNYNTDSLQKIFYNNQFDYDTVIYDLQAVDTSLKVLGELLFESGRYDFVIPENRFLEFQKNSFMTLEMPWSEVKEICETYQTDAVLSLDHFATRVTTNYDRESYFDSNNNGFYSAYIAQMMIYYEALFRIYDPIQEKILTREFLRDTLYWKETDVSSRNLFEKFTPVKKGLIEAGIAISLDFSDKIGTVWREEQRKYFPKGNSNFTKAKLFVDSGKWETAITIWKETAEKTDSKSLKSKAQFNVAVGYELSGDLNQAISWALKSYDTMYRLATYEYLEILKRRKNELKKLTK